RENPERIGEGWLSALQPKHPIIKRCCLGGGDLQNLTEPALVARSLPNRNGVAIAAGIGNVPGRVAHLKVVEDVVASPLVTFQFALGSFAEFDFGHGYAPKPSA